MASGEISVGIDIEEPSGLQRTNEPVRIGVPFPQGLLIEPTDLTVIDSSGEPVAHQTRVLGRWSDGSVKWILIDLQVSLGAHARETWFLQDLKSPVAPSMGILSVLDTEEEVAIDSGHAQFAIEKAGNALVSRVRVNGKDFLDEPGIAVLLTDDFGQRCEGVIDDVRIEDAGPVRATLAVSGGFIGNGKRLPINFKARISLYASSGLLELDFGLRNPMAAAHPGNLWDLGDIGSFCFNDLTVVLHPKSDVLGLLWQAEAESELQQQGSGPWSLYQDSSGGENWNSCNHVGADGRLTVTFRGYRVRSETSSAPGLYGLRASPVVAAETELGFLVVTVDKFWQNFPKALRWQDGVLEIALFPYESETCHELQGGERKRHLIRFALGHSEGIKVQQATREPVRLAIDPDWVEHSGALSNFVAPHASENRRYQTYVQSVIEGPNSFFKKREVIDEYGWRNFGEVYADHEAVKKLEGEPLVSHYNNQYDYLNAACIHLLRSGDDRWRQLLVEGVRHLIDIDIYNTELDRLVYNGGLFWHTDHYREAATATHRTYSGSSGCGSNYGGGPSNEHNYTTGLLHYYYISGDREAREAVLRLAEWVLQMDDGSHSIFAFLDSSDTGKASCTVSLDYQKAGRGAGNSINALLDAYELSTNRKFLAKAEQLICRCIHPADDISALGLDEPEYRWSYLVFLQALGKYLSVKVESDEVDYFFYYARDSLLHYGQWVLENEVPYKEILHKVEIPTETWPAQDIRKCHVMHLAANYSGSDRRLAFANRANYFFDHCLHDLLSFNTSGLARPRVILAGYGYIHSYYQKNGYLAEEGRECSREHNHDFGIPVKFVPQRPLFQKLSWDRALVSWRLARQRIRLMARRKKKRHYSVRQEIR